MTALLQVVDLYYRLLGAEPQHVAFEGGWLVSIGGLPLATVSADGVVEHVASREALAVAAQILRLRRAA